MSGEITKEEMDAINADPRLSALYKSMQADYTRKTQSVATDAKAMKDLQDQLDEMKSYVEQAEAYVNYAAPIVKQFEEGQYTFPTNGNDKGGKGRNQGSSSSKDAIIDELLGRIEHLEGQFDKGGQEINNAIGRLDKMFNYLGEINDLQIQRFNETGKFDLDIPKLLSTAKERKTPSLRDAFEFAYKDERIDRAAKAKADELYKEAQAKHTTEEGKRTPSPKSETIFRLSKDTPKSFGEATEQALNAANTGKSSEGSSNNQSSQSQAGGKAAGGGE